MVSFENIILQIFTGIINTVLLWLAIRLYYALGNLDNLSYLSDIAEELRKIRKVLENINVK